MALNGKELAKIVDATVINPDATVADIDVYKRQKF